MIKSMNSKQMYEHIVIFVECVNNDMKSVKESKRMYHEFRENSSGLPEFLDFVRGIYFNLRGIKEYKKYSMGIFDNVNLKTNVFHGKSIIQMVIIKDKIDNSFEKLNQLMFLNPNNKEEIHRELLKFIIDYGVLEEELTDWQDRKIIKDILNSL